MSESGELPRYHHGDLRNALLAAAEQILEEQGTSGLSLRGVAKRASVSHAAPYRHFKDKAALLRALAQAGFEQLTAAIQTAVGHSPQNPEGKLVEAGAAYVRRGVDHPAMTKLMFAGDVTADSDAAYKQAVAAAFEVLLTIIEAGINTGAFRAREPRELALVAWTSMHGMTMLITAQLLEREAGSAGALDERVRAIARNVIYGISK